MRARLKTMVMELRQTMHDIVRETGRWLRSVLTGFYQYHATHGNPPSAVAARPMPLQWPSHPSWGKWFPIFERCFPVALVQHAYPRHRFPYQ
jgi:hypothetical protein